MGEIGRAEVVGLAVAFMLSSFALLAMWVELAKTLGMASWCCR